MASKIGDQTAAPQRSLTWLENPLQNVPVPERVAFLRKIGADAKTKYEQLASETDTRLKELEPRHAVCCAGYYLVFVGDKPFSSKGDSFGQHQAELLQALLLRHPIDFYEEAIGTPKQVQEALDLTKELTDARMKAAYAEIPEDPAEFARRSVVEEMRLHTQLIRGDFYPEQLPRLFRPILDRIEQRFVAVYGVSPTLLFDFLQRLTRRIEDRLNDHVKRVASFYKSTNVPALVKAYKKAFPTVEVESDKIEEFFPNKKTRLDNLKNAMLAHSDLRVPYIFEITKDDITEELKALNAAESTDAVAASLEHLSVAFGDLADKPFDHIILDNPVWVRPLIRYEELWLLPLPTTLVSYCPDVFRALAEADNDLKQAFEDARAAILEVQVAEAFKAAFPGDSVWRSVKWRDPTDNKLYENDVVVLVDRWLVLVEAKSGQVTDSARRGSYDRLKREIKKLIVDPAEQSKRFADYLTNNKQAHQFECREGLCNLDSSKIDGILRLNVTSENIGNLNARSSKLIEAGLIPAGSDLPPTMGIGWLDIVLRFLGSKSAIIHYLQRRKSFEASADYFADELDLVAFYMDTGFNIGDTETDGTPLLIYGYSGDLDVALTRSRDQPLGSQQLAITPYWQRLIDSVETEGQDDWLTRALRLRNVAKEDQAALERKIRHAIYNANSKGPAVISVSYGPKTRREGIVVSVRGPKHNVKMLDADLSATYLAMSGAGIGNPLFLSFIAPKSTNATTHCIVDSADRLIAAAATTA